MKALPHQVNKATTLVRKLKLYGLTLFAGEVRSGKTAAFILAAETITPKYIVITKKGAIDGVKKFTNNVTNYHQVSKLKPEYDLVVLDECHRYITGYPKRSKLWKDIYNITSKAKYIIFSSGTPTPESYAMLFNMLALSLDNPWNRYKKFTQWHQDYGIYATKVIGYDEARGKVRTALDYSQTKDDKILKDIDHLKVSMTRVEAGHKFEPTDKLHLIPLTTQQEEIISTIKKSRIYNFNEEYSIVCDTASKYLQKLHQIAGGFVNAVDLCEQTKVFQVDSNKVKYIQENFNPDDTIILAYYIPEQEYLASIFPNVGSLTKNSDGVDFSHFKNMVIYSMGFSAATYQQVIGRQLNFMTRKEEVIIHFLISGLDQYVYDAVSSKQNFTTKWYKEKDNDKAI